MSDLAQDSYGGSSTLITQPAHLQALDSLGTQGSKDF